VEEIKPMNEEEEIKPMNEEKEAEVEAEAEVEGEIIVKNPDTMIETVTEERTGAEAGIVTTKEETIEIGIVEVVTRIGTGIETEVEEVAVEAGREEIKGAEAEALIGSDVIVSAEAEVGTERDRVLYPLYLHGRNQSQTNPLQLV
jgi:hypothetical protein